MKYKTEQEFFETRAGNLLRLFQVIYDSQEEYDALLCLMKFNLREIVEKHKELQQCFEKE